MINSNGGKLRRQRPSSVAGDKVGFSKNAKKSFSVGDEVLFFRNAKERDSMSMIPLLSQPQKSLELQLFSFPVWCACSLNIKISSGDFPPKTTSPNAWQLRNVIGSSFLAWHVVMHPKFTCFSLPILPSRGFSNQCEKKPLTLSQACDHMDTMHAWTSNWRGSYVPLHVTLQRKPMY